MLFNEIIDDYMMECEVDVTMDELMDDVMEDIYIYDIIDELIYLTVDGLFNDREFNHRFSIWSHW